MSINSSLQQIAGGVENYNIIGYVIIVISIISIILMSRVNKMVSEKTIKVNPTVVEH